MDEAALLAAICAHPEEVTPRLAFADWLLEQSDQPRRDRGEFILTQCRLADGGLAADERRELLKREKELLGLYRGTWTGILQESVTNCAFHRGFPDRITLDAAAFTAWFGELSQETPVVRVHLSHLNAETAEGVAHDSHFERVIQLDLSREHLTPDVLRTLLASPFLNRLTYLNLSGNVNGDGLAGVLAASPVLKRLSFLSLANTGLTPDGVSRLISALTQGELPALRWLNLRNRSLTPGNWADTVLAWLRPEMLSELRMSLEGQLSRFRLSPPVRDPGPLTRLKTVFAKLPSDLQFWVRTLENANRSRLAAAIRVNPLPPEVHRAFAAVCIRQLEWWTQRDTKLRREYGVAGTRSAPVVPPNATTDRAALADLVMLPGVGAVGTSAETWLRDWLLRLYEHHLAGTLNPEGRTR